MKIEVLRNSILSLFDLISDIDLRESKRLFNEIKSKLDTISTESESIQYRSAILEPWYFDNNRIDLLNNNLSNFYENIKFKYWNSKTYILDEILILRKWNNNLIPFYYATVLPHRYPIDETARERLTKSLYQNSRHLFKYVDLLWDKKALSVWSWENELFDILYTVDDFMICFNSYMHSIENIEELFNIKSTDLIKEIENFNFI